MKILELKLLKIISVLVVLISLSSCATQKMEEDIDNLKKSLQDLRNIQADQVTKIAALEDEVRKINGSIQEAQYATEQRIGKSLEDLQGLQGDVSNLRRRVPPPAIVPESEFVKDEEALDGLPSELSGPVSQGLQSLRDGNFERALAYWDESLDLGEGTDWESMVIFWRTVTLEGLQRSSEAVQEYLNLVKRFPKYKRAPLALYRQADLLLRLGDKKVGKLALNKLITDYPKSPEAAQAKLKLKEL